MNATWRGLVAGFAAGALGMVIYIVPETLAVIGFVILALLILD